MYKSPYNEKCTQYQAFGIKGSGWHCGWHTGNDTYATTGADIHSVADGTVASINACGTSYGQHVFIKNSDGIGVLYAHMINGSICVKVGQKVSAGTKIGRQGTTGSIGAREHLHLEIHTKGYYQYAKDVADPRWYVDYSNFEEVKKLPKTVYSIDNVQVQVIDIDKFKIKQVDNRKRNLDELNYANAGFFAKATNSTIPVGNLVVDGNIITDTANQADWLNTARKEQTTLVIHNNNTAEMIKVSDMMTVPAVKYAISGIPIIRNGYKVSMDDIKAEGYFGNECYWTWHGFLGIRDGRLVYVASETDFDMMVYLLEVLGIKDAIKVDGGGSFILHNGSFEISTPENRQINNIITWEG